VFASKLAFSFCFAALVAAGAHADLAARAATTFAADDTKGALAW
jgi:hypothetical protein